MILRESLSFSARCYFKREIGRKSVRSIFERAHALYVIRDSRYCNRAARGSIVVDVEFVGTLVECEAEYKGDDHAGIKGHRAVNEFGRQVADERQIEGR